MDGITFARQADGSFSRDGEITSTHGRFQWLRNDGSWDGGWAKEPVSVLLERMSLSGPYKYDQYRILPAEMLPLEIKPTCAGCGAIAGEDCQKACEYIFGPAEVTESLPIQFIQFNTDHQFNLSIKVVTEGKHFGKRKPKQIWFNSVRCAELFLMANGDIKPLRRCEEPTIGNGQRLLAYLGGPEVKARKKRGPNKSYLANLASLESIDALAGQHPIFKGVGHDGNKGLTRT
jgi:hypothetical protein